MDEGYGGYLDGDPRPPDQRTPLNTPSPQEEGEPGEGDGDLMQVDEAFHTTFAVNEHRIMPRNAKYEDSLCCCMAFAHNRDFPRYNLNTSATGLPRGPSTMWNVVLPPETGQFM